MIPSIMTWLYFWVIVNFFSLNFWVIFYFLGHNGLILGLGQGSYAILGSTHVVEQFLFSMIPSILTFEFDLILGPFSTFWSPNGLFWGSFQIFFGPNELFLGLGQSSKTVLGSNHVVEQLLFPIVSSILTFDFDLILGSFFTFLGP